MGWRYGFALLPLMAMPAHADCLAEIRAVLHAVNDAGPYTMEGISESKTGPVDVFSKIGSPSEMYMHSQGEGFFYEVTVRDGRAWSNQGQGWVELDITVAYVMTEAVVENYLGTFDGIDEAQCLGAVEDGGKSLLAYSLSVTLSGGPAQVDVFVDPDIGLPVRMRMVGDQGLGKSSSDMRVTYDRAVTVDVPPGF